MPNFLVMQGDGEVSFCGAIEMSGWLDLKYGILILSHLHTPAIHISY